MHGISGSGLRWIAEWQRDRKKEPTEMEENLCKNIISDVLSLSAALDIFK